MGYVIPLPKEVVGSDLANALKESASRLKWKYMEDPTETRLYHAEPEIDFARNPSELARKIPREGIKTKITKVSICLKEGHILPSRYTAHEDIELDKSYSVLFLDSRYNETRDTENMKTLMLTLEDLFHGQ